MKEHLSKEQAIKSHRALWNWIADEIEKYIQADNKYLQNWFIDDIKNCQQIPKKSDFRKPEHPEISKCMHYCYTCEYAKQQLMIKESTQDVYNKKRCNYCPLKWPNSTTETNIGYCTTENHDGLYNQYLDAINTEYNLQKAIDIARQIANLTEKS